MNRMWIRCVAVTAVCTLSLAAWLSATAQEREPQPPAAQTQPDQDSAADRTQRDATQRDATAHHAGKKLDDRTLAACLLIGNQKEIALSRLGVSQSQNPEVKQFAQQMVQDHGQFVSRLAQAAGLQRRDGTGTDGAATDRDATNRARPGQTTLPGQADQARGAARGQSELQQFDVENMPFVSFEREVAEQCLQSAQQFLGQQQGSEFDRWFMAIQLMGHMGMRDHLKVAQRHASGELRQIIDQGLQTTEAHIQQAEQVMRQVAAATPQTQRGTVRPGATNQ